MLKHFQTKVIRADFYYFSAVFIIYFYIIIYSEAETDGDCLS